MINRMANKPKAFANMRKKPFELDFVLSCSGEGPNVETLSLTQVNYSRHPELVEGSQEISRDLHTQ